MSKIPIPLKEVVKNVAIPIMFVLSCSPLTHDVHLDEQYTHQVGRDVNRLIELLFREDKEGEPPDL